MKRELEKAEETSDHSGSQTRVVEREGKLAEES
jgi:hypothetical protein